MNPATERSKKTPKSRSKPSNPPATRQEQKVYDDLWRFVTEVRPEVADRVAMPQASLRQILDLVQYPFLFMTNDQVLRFCAIRSKLNLPYSWLFAPDGNESPSENCFIVHNESQRQPANALQYTRSYAKPTRCHERYCVAP